MKLLDTQISPYNPELIAKTYHDRDWQEYVTRCYVGGVYRESWDIFSDSFDEAMGSVRCMFEYYRTNPIPE